MIDRTRAELQSRGYRVITNCAEKWGDFKPKKKGLDRLEQRYEDNVEDKVKDKVKDRIAKIRDRRDNDQRMARKADH